jgi:ATP/maltotriose-dependent transcriptional regulator MalT
MSIETEVKAVEATVAGEVKTVESEVEKAVEGTVAAAEGEVKTVAAAVVAEAKKVEGEVKAALVRTTTDEQLFLREAELEFLKAQMEIQRLQNIADTKSKAYTAFVENLFTKYALSKAEYVFDGAVNVFKKL